MFEYRVLLLQPDGWHLVWTCFSERSARDLADEVCYNTQKPVSVQVIDGQGIARNLEL